MQRDDRKWIIPFAATILAMMALQMSNLGSSPLLKEAQKEFRMSDSLYGTFTGMYGLSALLLSVPGGMLARRFGEKKVMTASLAGRHAWTDRTQPGLEHSHRLCRACSLARGLPARFCVCDDRHRAHGSGLAEKPVDGNSRRDHRVRHCGRGAVRQQNRTELRLAQRHSCFCRHCAAWALSFSTHLYRVRSDASRARHRTQARETGSKGQREHRKSASIFRNPVVWALAVLEGIVGVGYFSSNWFIPRAVEVVFGQKAMTGCIYHQHRIHRRHHRQYIFWLSHGPVQQVECHGLMMIILDPRLYA